ncbi:hypothetical protein CKO_04875 [Citrobacter koseri ATCC BAA-895]|uniref:Uncharacterized protein n=1 Tax=Citrobacter koseri (strain ATCC BAA-895 / CDC 4225-83 / SGSC4696) TaxID=290338 RepID=A8AR06_CITK8|nr:hypothetical protein CKO_04875 [Citrobacter koseri ATCC BAA-895]
MCPVALRLPGLLDPVGRVRRSRHPAFCFFHIIFTIPSSSYHPADVWLSFICN